MSSLEQLERLVAPLVGLVGQVVIQPSAITSPALSIAMASLGNLAAVHRNVAEVTRGRDAFGAIDGAGTGASSQHARLLAIAEALERYSSATYLETQLIRASATELGAEALDLNLVPRCSEAELAHPRCPVRAPDRSAPQRWVRGYSLTRAKPVWVPAAMTYLYFQQSEAERFTVPISTGCAAHTNLADAIVSGICEVVERDAISLTWLQRLRLPELAVDDLDSTEAEPWHRSARAGRKLRVFDATTDLGIPSLYMVETFETGSNISQLVACVTELNPRDALAKLCRESASIYYALNAGGSAPESLDDFRDVKHGALHMAARSRRSAFDFLLEGPRERRPLSRCHAFATGSTDEKLARLLSLFRERGIEVVCVDLTSDEARSVGFHVVRVIIPELMPLSFTYRARYLGHPRLYEAPARYGFSASSESNINPFPQPFA